MLAEYVSDLRVTGDTITLTDIMGKEIVVFGSLQRVDLVKNAIIIAEQPQDVKKEENMSTERIL
jgi:predicted RNA-binding protein